MRHEVPGELSRGGRGAVLLVRRAMSDHLRSTPGNRSALPDGREQRRRRGNDDRRAISRVRGHGAVGSTAINSRTTPHPIDVGHRMGILEPSYYRYCYYGKHQKHQILLRLPDCESRDYRPHPHGTREADAAAKRTWYLARQRVLNGK